MSTTIRLRRGTSSQWSSANSVLDDGEIGFATDLNKIKIGDGTTAWNSLSYASLTESEINNIVNSAVSNHSSDTTNVHGIADTGLIIVEGDARLTDARTPTSHAASHQSGGSDALTLAQSQVTNLTSDLASKVSGNGITDIVALTQAAYDALTPDPTTLYVVTD